ncbi:MAG: hypothetical protein AMJ38_02295 [Dehalococcoidia bacterium DG_22]|nr:MAG: hypothetical protein AMJ38_02295 [Dehalococcoidia bacterium DG_22]
MAQRQPLHRHPRERPQGDDEGTAPLDQLLDTSLVIGLGLILHDFDLDGLLLGGPLEPFVGVLVE